MQICVPWCSHLINLKFPSLMFSLSRKTSRWSDYPSWNKWRVNWDHVFIKMKQNMWTKPANTTKYINISCNIRRLSQTNIQTTCQGPWNKVHSWNRISSEVHCLRNYIMTTKGFRVGNQRHWLGQCFRNPSANVIQICKNCYYKLKQPRKPTWNLNITLLKMEKTHLPNLVPNLHLLLPWI